jgi:hypothetical protein
MEIKQEKALTKVLLRTLAQNMSATTQTPQIFTQVHRK